MILEVIRPHMKKAGLAFTQPIITREDKEFIVTTLYDTKTGESIESDMELKDIKFQGMNELQSKGSAITYLRRYGLMSILGLVTEEDDNDAQGKTEAKAKSGSKAKDNTPALPFLNPEPKEKWNKALKFLADGGKIGDIKKKYKLSKVNEERLLNEAITFDDLPFDRETAEDAEIASTEDVVVEPITPGEPNELFDEQGGPVTE